jgi:TRAP-type mannitol/chloroaromatic compound transport system permease small subunit
MSILRRLSAAIDGLNDTIGAGIRWLTLAMVLVGAIGALLRYFSRGLGLSMNLTPLVEGQWYIFSLIFLLGTAYGVNQDVHVRVDVMFARLPAKTRATIDLVGTVLFMIPFALAMLWLSYPAVQNSWSIREMSPDPGGLPRYHIKALILVSFGLLLLQGMSHVIKQVAVLRGVVEPPAMGAHLPEPRTEIPTTDVSTGSDEA